MAPPREHNDIKLYPSAELRGLVYQEVEWLNRGLNELKDMSRIIGKTLFHELAPIETVDKELHSPLQSFDISGKAP
jgi:hypothetical protein